jgi:two-component system sensor histidine kinase VanS
MHKNAEQVARFHASARLRPRFWYAAMLLIVIAALLVALYLVLPYIASVPFPDGTRRGADGPVASRSEILGALIRVSRASQIPAIFVRVSAVILALLVAIGIAMRCFRLPQVSARLRLTASYALFLVAAGGVLLVGIYIVLRYVPTYPLSASNPAELRPYVASRFEILRALVRISGIILAILAIVGLGGGWILAGWILRPLQRINEAAQIAASGRLDHRIRLAGRNDEFRQLADTFDVMLDRLHDAFSVQERFAANASHELRTPLTVNATLLDVARRNPDEQDYDTLIERLTITNARAIGLTEALLRLADANSIMASSEPVDLAGIVRDAIDESADEAESQRVRIDARLAPAPAIGDATLLRQLATNVVQNAIRHNSSPGRAWIETEYDRQRSAVTLRIENTGPRYTSKQVGTFTEPFLRGAGRTRRSEHETGYGLGLALVARIVAVHGGALSLAPRPVGGLVLVGNFPIQTRTKSNETARIRHRSGMPTARVTTRAARE